MKLFHVKHSVGFEVVIPGSVLMLNNKLLNAKEI